MLPSALLLHLVQGNTVQACPNAQGLAAGHYAAILGVEHPVVHYKAVEGTTQKSGGAALLQQTQRYVCGQLLGLSKNA